MKIFCNDCGFTSNIQFELRSEISCFCTHTWKVIQNNLTIERLESDLSLSYKNIYSKIAESDLDVSIQDTNILYERAKNDLINLGDITGLNVLEIGPGRGDLTRLLVESGAKVFIADLISSYLNNLATLDCITIEVDAQNLTIMEHFDLVIANDVIEHVFRPADLLISINRSLKPGGLLYLRCPQKESLNTYSNLSGYEHEIVHLRSYTEKMLRNEIMNSGFTVKKVFQIKAAAPYLRSIAFKINFNLKNGIGIAKITSLTKLGTKFINLCYGQFDPNKSTSRKLMMPILNIVKKLFTHSSEIAFLARKV